MKVVIIENKEFVTISLERYEGLKEEITKSNKVIEGFKKYGILRTSGSIFNLWNTYYKNEQVLDTELTREVVNLKEISVLIEERISNFNNKSFFKRLFTLRIKEALL